MTKLRKMLASFFGPSADSFKEMMISLRAAAMEERAAADELVASMSDEAEGLRDVADSLRAQLAGAVEEAVSARRERDVLWQQNVEQARLVSQLRKELN